MKRIRTTERTLKTIRDTGAFLPRVEPRDVEAAVGAEASTEMVLRTDALVTRSKP